jgi:C-terminal processing protease CtpA/Prc
MARRYLLIIASMTMLVGVTQAQKFDTRQRDDAREMLRNIAKDLRDNYYDPTFHGFDFDARVREVDEKLKNANNLSQAFSLIGWVFDGLDDSHTSFIPPRRTYRLERGWHMQMIGNRCFVTRVQPKSDAEAKGLKAGDEVLSLNGIQPTRANFPTMQYVLGVLAPRPVTQLIVRGNDGQQRQLEINSKPTQLRKLVDIRFEGSGDAAIWDLIREIENYEHWTRVRCTDKGEELGICKVPDFEMEKDTVHELISYAKRHKNVILDLRGNPGGYPDILNYTLGGFFDHAVKVDDLVGRKETKPEMAKPGHFRFDGKLVVLVDSNSSSAAEIFARVIQLEKRGVVVGDRSSGMVMQGRYCDHTLGLETVSWYGAMVSDADVIMSDGKRLEKNGVIPDEFLLPTQADLTAGRDPVLAHAAELLGVKISAEDAGKLFPYEWPKN